MPKRVEVIGAVAFSSLGPDLRWDVSLGVTEALKRDYGHSLPDGYDFGTPRISDVLLSDDPEIDVVTVDPKKLKACPRLTGAYHVGTVRKYEKAFLRGDQFPPIVIDSGTRKMLVEGAHRACAAERAEVPEIQALDVASIDLEEVVRHGDKLLFRR